MSINIPNKAEVAKQKPDQADTQQARATDDGMPESTERELYELTHADAARINQHLEGGYVNAGELIAIEYIEGKPHFVRDKVAVSLGVAP